MTDGKRQQPGLSADGARKAELRQERQGRALRENLTKRKAQNRAREAPAGPASAGSCDPAPAAGRDSGG